MNQFDSGFWDVYIAIVTVVSIVACAALAEKTTGHVWDEDLAEYNNPLPGWWRWLFYITIVFSLAYLVLYPGLGKLPGVLGWTSAGAYANEVNAFDARTEPLYAKYLAMDVKQAA